MPLDFAILLGDCFYDGTEEMHRYLRAELAKGYALPFPVFYVVGNHDVSPNGFPVKRFEEVYGPSIFSFEYRKCLFIILRILDAPFANEDSLAFLADFQGINLSKYIHTFAFMHISSHPCHLHIEHVLSERPKNLLCSYWRRRGTSCKDTKRNLPSLRYGHGCDETLS